MLEVVDPLKIVDVWTGRRITKWVVSCFFVSLVLAVVQAWVDPLTYKAICKISTVETAGG